MKQTVYVESTIPAFYHEARTEPEMIARRDWTRRFWDERASEYELLTSVAAIDELSRGEYEGKESVLELLESVPLIPIEEPLVEIVRAYVMHRVMPEDPLGDALHLALASHRRCDVLLTWNSRQLANADKLAKIRRVNSLLGLFVPRIVTPLDLLGGDAA